MPCSFIQHKQPVRVENALPQRISEMKHEKQDIKMEQDTPINNISIAYPSNNAYFSYSGDTQIGARHNIQPISKIENIELAIRELQVGERIRIELKKQGRTVSWLAQQLSMERTSLYYVFRQNSIDLELLLRISCFLEHNFLQDVADVFEIYGL